LVELPLKSVQLNSDSNFTLECIISGEPEPEVTWFKDNIELEMLPEPVKSSFCPSKFMNVQKLTLMNTDPEIHNGTYTCRAENKFGEASTNCAAIIRSKYSIIFFFKEKQI
jgi:hypothetical protein